MHYFGHPIDNGVKFLYFVRSLLPSKSPILTKYWWVPLVAGSTSKRDKCIKSYYMYRYNSTR